MQRKDKILILTPMKRGVGRDAHLPEVSVFANLRALAFEIEYFHERVLEEVQSWPADVLADYARLAELLAEYART